MKTQGVALVCTALLFAVSAQAGTDIGKCVPSQASVVIPANTTQVICTVSFPCFGSDPGPNNSSVHIGASSLEVSYKGKRPTQIVSTLQSSCTRTATQDTHGYNVYSKQERHFSLVGALEFPGADPFAPNAASCSGPANPNGCVVELSLEPIGGSVTIITNTDTTPASGTAIEIDASDGTL